jgi:DNA polymerase-3 subunit delta'
MSRDVEAPPESDRFDEAPHPRETLDFFGNEAAERELLDAYRRDKMAQAWILSGPQGVGKATLAWRVARFLLAHPNPRATETQAAQSLYVPGDSPAARRIASMALADIFLLRRSWNDKTKKFYTEIRIDDVREIIQSLHRSSGTGGWRVAIVDCADDLNRASANALLKLIEEPPQRSIFLIVAHQLGRVLPTIRSRCRKIALRPLGEAEIAQAIRGLGEPWSTLEGEDVAAAAASAEGSVQEALRLLDGDGVAFDRTLRGLFGKLPQVDWLAVHALADKLTGRDNESSYETFMRALRRWIDQEVKSGAEQGARPARLLAYADAWEEITQAARETEVFNFDKRALVLGVFERLERATGFVGE